MAGLDYGCGNLTEFNLEVLTLVDAANQTTACSSLLVIS